MTAQGLSENEVNTMTKHRDSNFSKSYRAEMSIPVATILAGFNSKDPTDTYFVPRAEIELPNNLDNPTRFDSLQNFLFPHLQTWKEQLQSDGADKNYHLAGQHFLYEVIPWVTKILIQDGVIWIKKFPNNSALQLLKNRLSSVQGMELLGVNYSIWAHEKRLEINEKVRHRNMDAITATQPEGGNNTLWHSVEGVKCEVQKLHDIAKEIHQSQNHIHRLMSVSNSR